MTRPVRCFAKTYDVVGSEGTSGTISGHIDMPESPTETPTPPPPPPTVEILDPMDGFGQNLSDLVSFTIPATGSVELTRIELWGYTRVGQPQPDLLQTFDASGTTQKTVNFDWQPEGAGSVSFYAKAYDVAGGEGTSETISGHID